MIRSRTVGIGDRFRRFLVKDYNYTLALSEFLIGLDVGTVGTPHMLLELVIIMFRWLLIRLRTVGIPNRFGPRFLVVEDYSL